jgi:gamma-glutamyltranspeptidase/glutathione hydrolase
MSKAQVSTGRRGMVVSGHKDASVAAWKVLSAGGGVADAAIAGAAALAVTQPQACTLGGDAFILVHDAKSRKTEGLNASGPSPAAVTEDTFKAGIPERGALTVNVPGVVAGWESLHKRYGRKPWNSLFASAIGLARDGCRASPVFARGTVVYRKLLDSFEPSKRLFPVLEANQVFKQPGLAQTLQAIADGGARAFYDGDVATSLAAACKAQGGIIEASDFSGYQPEWVQPLEVSYRGHRVRAMPPNSFGLYLLLQLLALEDQNLKGEALESPGRLTALVRAARAAFAVGNKAVADPRFVREDISSLLGEEGRKRLKAHGTARMPDLGGTAVISVVDSEGNAVTIVQSIFLVFGSGTVDPNTGILMSNRMIGFTTEAGHPNEVAPRKRPAHTLCPCQVFDAQGEIRYAVGTPGGPGQTLTISQVLQAVLDRGASLEEAIATPRWSQDLGSAAVVEHNLPQATVEAMKRAGIELQIAQPNSPFFGSAEGIHRGTDGRFTGVADFRRDAWAHGE